MCIEPVGEGAIRVTTDRAGEGISGKSLNAKGTGLIMFAGAGSRSRAVLAVNSLIAEFPAQRDRALLWSPVAFGAGAAIYLGLKHEPQVWPSALTVLIAGIVFLGLWLWGRRYWLSLLAGMVLLGASGFLVAKLHSDAMAAPIAPVRAGFARIEGWVMDVDTPSPRGERLLIAPVRISGLTPDQTPVRVRIVLGTPGGPEAAPPPGTPIALSALLDPPPGPAVPGGYDFARDAWFSGIGGVGLAQTPPDYAPLPPAPWPLRLEMAVNALRWRVASQLVADIRGVMGPNDGGAAGLAAAVTTSHQDWLAPGQRDDLRASGLAHMLAIAGLHTAAVSGFAFFAARALFAAIPWLALRFPAKKLAALVALVAVGAYLLLSGAHAPARRAAITASVAFFAILVDRRAVSLHSLAVAALLILVMEPEVVVSPGFEMSFCATAALIALAEVWRLPSRATDLPWALRLLQRGRDILLGALAVSVVAGAATSPFAIQHFNRMANYGVLANLTADLVASLALMPALALALAAQAVGLDPGFLSPVLLAAGWAARTVLEIGQTFAQAPGSGLSSPSAPEAALLVSYLGIVFACLWRGRLRLLGVILSFAVLVWPRGPAPAAWIANDGGDAAVAVHGEAVPLRPDMRAYALGQWAQRRALRLPANLDAAAVAHFTCNRLSCRPRGEDHPAIAAWWTRRSPKPQMLADLCSQADVLILRAEAATPAECQAAIVLRREDFEKGGAAELYPESGGWRLDWAQARRGERPWSLSDSAG